VIWSAPTSWSFKIYRSLFNPKKVFANQTIHLSRENLSFLNIARPKVATSYNTPGLALGFVHEKSRACKTELGMMMNGESL